jgi:hypothetical protein
VEAVRQDELTAIPGSLVAEHPPGRPKALVGYGAGPEAAVPSALLRSRHIRISGSGAGSGSMVVIRAEMPVYLGLIADGRVDVPVRTFPLPAVGDAWLAAAGRGHRVVVLP